MVGLRLMSKTSTNIKVVNSISELGREEWNECAIFHSDDDSNETADPFTCYDFLHALEKSGSVGEGTGWIPYHLAAFNKNKFIGAVPLYCLLYTSPSPRDYAASRMPSSA